jgi:hypothetical protein
MKEKSHLVGEEWVDPVFGPVRRIPKPTPWQMPRGNWLMTKEDQEAARASQSSSMGVAKMDYKEHSLRVGYIHMNLAALESSLRFFLLKANGQVFSSPTPSDTDAPINYITKFASLGGLIKEYNEALKSSEGAYKITDEAVRIRDALAHGRLVAPANGFPVTLWKFGAERSGRVPIEYNDVLTVDWLDNAWKLINKQRVLVDECSKHRNYPIT